MIDGKKYKGWELLTTSESDSEEKDRRTEWEKSWQIPERTSSQPRGSSVATEKTSKTENAEEEEPASFSLQIGKVEGEQIKSGKKNVVAKLNNMRKSATSKNGVLIDLMCGKPGNRFNLKARVTKVAEYASFSGLLKSVGWKNVVPDAGDFKEALKACYGRHGTPETEKEHGVIAWHVTTNLQELPSEKIPQNQNSGAATVITADKQIGEAKITEATPKNVEKHKACQEPVDVLGLAMPRCFVDAALEAPREEMAPEILDAVDAADADSKTKEDEKWYSVRKDMASAAYDEMRKEREKQKADMKANFDFEF